MANTGKIVSAVFVGAALGAAAGLLFAPGKGSETRNKIMRRTKSLRDTGSDTLKEFKEKAMRNTDHSGVDEMRKSKTTVSGSASR